MATCPRCKGHLTDHHRCPRRPAFVAIEIGLWALAGAFAGFLIVVLFDPHGQLTSLEPIGAGAGALIAVGINRLTRS